ncbi:hypothetical protein B5X24_HaOG207032 [Helicoverpa armigera]|uniref:Uncharacterized protein n=1 Tax=Helicoverpa armigera TaxID=29058 RepID=A0A2W1BNR9_HELAM|nr:hypothetical protein B5X24_HaOG207032 [Helicoverpa armigera]
MFVITKEDEKTDIGVAKTSDPDKFVQLAIKSGDSLLEHLHMLAQEALDHADLPVLTATLGAAALLKNSMYCYVQHVEDSGNAERYSLLQACYKRYTAMAEAVGERVLDLHNRVLSLYILQDSGGRPIDGATRTVHETGTPSVQGWWLYMNGSRRDLWDTVPPRMAQRIFAGMLNETLTILTVRYCQTNTTEITTRLLLNDILNILLCVAQLLPSICANGSDLAGLDVKHQTRDLDDPSVRSTHDLNNKTALGLELIVLLAQPQPNWALIVKVLMMRDCHLARLLLIRAIRHMCTDNLPFAASGRWYISGANVKCSGFLCTADGFCRFGGDVNPGVELARAAGALTYILATIGSKTELKTTLCYALEISGRDWAACLDKRQVWCDRRPSWLAGILAIVGSVLQFIPPILVNAVQGGASMYQALCSIDEDDKHTRDIQLLIERAKRKVVLSEQFGLEDFPEFAELFEEGDVPGSNAERASDAAALTSQILMTSPGRDSLRVIYEHLALHSEWIYKELGIQESCDINIPLNKAPLLYTMFHIGKQPFDQYLRGEWPIPWSKLVAVAKAWSGLEGVRVHINRRTDVRNMKAQGKGNKQLMQLCAMFKSNSEGVL